MAGQICQHLCQFCWNWSFLFTIFGFKMRKCIYEHNQAKQWPSGSWNSLFWKKSSKFIQKLPKFNINQAWKALRIVFKLTKSTSGVSLFWLDYGNIINLLKLLLGGLIASNQLPSNYKRSSGKEIPKPCHVHVLSSIQHCRTKRSCPRCITRGIIW